MSGYYRRRARKGARAISVLHGQLGSGRVFGGVGRLASQNRGLQVRFLPGLFGVKASSRLASHEAFAFPCRVQPVSRIVPKLARLRGPASPVERPGSELAFILLFV